MKHKSGRRLCAFLCNDMVILADDGVSRHYETVQYLSQSLADL